MSTPSNQAVPFHPWTTYMYACEEARRLGDRRTGTEHLFLGLLEDPRMESLVRVELSQARHALESLDRNALQALGLDLVFETPPLPMRDVGARPRVKSVLKHRLRLTPAAKRVLQETGKPIRRGRRISPTDVLVRLLDLEPPDPVAVLIVELNLDVGAVRHRLGQS